MKLIIKTIKEGNLPEIGRIFMESFNKAANKGWTEKTVKKYMHYWFKKKPDLFLVGLDDGKIVGGAMGDIKPMTTGNQLIDVNIFVDILKQNQGIGKKLFKTLIKKAVQNYQIAGIIAMADKTAEFPMSWYKKIGFSKCRWVQIEGKPKKILKNL
jgi:L-amino acid N-acyltransferase YncA